ncbi:MAG: protein kinase [Myxococcales bacterium]|nr:protein kinase [Myxococcales bacterium]
MVSGVRVRDPTGAQSIVDGRREQIGRYVVLKALGEGGMGVVLAAYDADLDRKVALKILREEIRDGSGAAMRMRREAQAMARLSHPNVAQVYEVAEDERGRLFLAMEYIEGLTLRAWLADQPRTWREILAVYVEAGRGLAAAHAAGLMHRDFKPKSRRPSPTAPQPTDRPHSHDLGRFERVGAYHATPVDAWMLQVLAKRWQRSGLAGESWGLSQRSTALPLPHGQGSLRPILGPRRTGASAGLASVNAPIADRRVRSASSMRSAMIPSMVREITTRLSCAAASASALLKGPRPRSFTTPWMYARASAIRFRMFSRADPSARRASPPAASPRRNHSISFCRQLAYSPSSAWFVPAGRSIGTKRTRPAARSSARWFQ